MRLGLTAPIDWLGVFEAMSFRGIRLSSLMIIGLNNSIVEIYDFMHIIATSPHGVRLSFDLSLGRCLLQS
jgi:hypothetical protein